MKVHELHANGSACPGLEALVAFSSGQLAAADLEEVGVHVSSCPRCGPALHALPDNDPLLVGLRGCFGADPLLDEPACGRLAARARALAVDEDATWPGTPPAIESDPRSARFGKYELLTRLGKGGMGVVYKARHSDIEREVALKMILGGAHADPRELARFRVEAAAVARLNHPNIVAIYDFGDDDGRPFFTMEFAAGGTLADRLAGPTPVSADETAEMVRLLARAVHDAHQHNVIHRDLKPANVLLRADGTPLLSDFGLAKLLDADGQTATDTILGTVSYMAPEQASGRAGTIGPATDVYGLGALLYELLGGRPPFQAADRLTTLDLVRTREPERPSRLRRGVSPELEAVCLKCLEKRPARRYATAAAVADEMDRYLRGEPPLESRWRRTKRAVRVVRRRPGTVAVVLLLLLAFGAWAVVGYSNNPERVRERIRRDLADGKEVQFIGKTGLPIVYDWDQGQRLAALPAGLDEPFAVSTQSTALVQLWAEPPPAYRLRAEVRHDQNPGNGQVGIYFNYRPADSGVPLPCCYAVNFADVGPAADAFVGPGGQRGRKVRVTFNYFEPRPDHRPDDGEQRLAVGPFYVPTDEDQWRKVEVLVTLDKVEVACSNNEGEMVPIAHCTRDDFDNWAAVLAMNQPVLKGHSFAATRCGAVGLYVRQGTASFRNVVLQPVDSEP